MKAGDKVKVLSNSFKDIEEMEMMVGGTFELAKVSPYGGNWADVYDHDKSTWWCFDKDELQLVEEVDYV